MNSFKRIGTDSTMFTGGLIIALWVFSTAAMLISYTRPM